VASLRPKLEIPDELPGIRGMRIALSIDLGCYAVDADVVANTRSAADRLRGAGATVEEVSLPWDRAMIGRAGRIHFGMIFGPSIKDLYERAGDQFTSYARRFVEESNLITKDAFVEGLALEAKIYEPLGELLEQFDALVCPTFLVPALPAEYDGETIVVDGHSLTDWIDVLMTLPFNIASRCPVLSVPSGRARNGVPTGLSIVGKTYDDVTVFRVAAAFERVQPWLDSPERRPSL
jgi:aspartyl-tRNA(Asn)/glutamyl-tRNA(Gln) amidotransferase subunit A